MKLTGPKKLNQKEQNEAFRKRDQNTLMAKPAPIKRPKTKTNNHQKNKTERF